MTFTLADQVKLFGFLAYDSMRGNPPRRASLQLTEACNLHCKMCTFWKYDGPTPDADRIKKIVDALKDIGVKHINLWGGEPYLHDDIIEIFRYIKERDFDLGIITNGTLLDEDKLKGSVEYLDEITFSVDSPHAEIHDRIRGTEGSHAVIQETIKKLLAIRGNRSTPEVTIDCTVQKDNIDHVHEMVEFAAQYGADVQFDPAQLHGYGNHLNNAILKIPAEIRWAAMERLKELSASGARINSAGNLKIMDSYLAGRDIHTPCFFPYVGLLVNPWGDIIYCWGWDKKMGNVLDDDFRQIWKSEEYRELRKTTLKCGLDRCKSCGFSMVRWPDFPGYQVLSALFGVRMALGKG